MVRRVPLRRMVAQLWRPDAGEIGRFRQLRAAAWTSKYGRGLVGVKSRKRSYGYNPATTSPEHGGTPDVCCSYS